MRNFLHITLSVILGSVLGYGLYYKILNKPIEAKASDITTDALFLSDQVAFEKQQQALKLTRPVYADTLQVSLQFLETAKSSAPASTKSIQSKPVNITEIRRTIEVAQLQKPSTVSMPISKVSAPELKEATSVHIAPATQEAVVSVVSAENDVDTEPQEEKKKRFLFFGKKSRNN